MFLSFSNISKCYVVIHPVHRIKSIKRMFYYIPAVKKWEQKSAGLQKAERQQSAVSFQLKRRFGVLRFFTVIAYDILIL